MGMYDENLPKFNYMSEFSDKELEREFFQQDMEKSLRYIKPLVLALGILNTLFLIPDYFLNTTRSIINSIATGRLIFVVLAFTLFLIINRLKNFRTLAYYITACEILCSLIFLFVLYHYETPSYLIQGYGVMVIIIGVFMVPNRWINMILVTMLTIIAFVLLSINIIENIKPSELYAGIVYLGVVFLLSSIMALRNHYNKRIQYINGKELLRISTTDHLSGAYNRVKLDESLNKLVEESQRLQKPFSVIFIDFDNFKDINDTYGHLVGDSVIVEFAKIIKANIREGDIFTRWGGEEFILLLPDAAKDRAIELGERLRDKIENHDFKDVNRVVTCSFGVVELKKEENLKSLLQRADQMLYFAKKAGKNLVYG